jgi:hypothetical protein
MADVGKHRVRRLGVPAGLHLRLLERAPLGDRGAMVLVFLDVQDILNIPYCQSH